MAVVGRDVELRELESFLDAGSGGRILVVTGEAGIGKTTLWRTAVELANTRGYRTLTCAASDSETQLALTSVRDLVGDEFDEISAELPAPQRHALAVALLREEPGSRPPNPGTVAVSFVSAVRALAARRPALVAVDDVQWLDQASAHVLRYALRRLTADPVAVLLTRRVGEGFDIDELDRLPRDRVRRLDLGVLSVGALGRILHERLGATFPRPTLTRLHEASGGNPLYALEVARGLLRSERPVRPGAPLPVPTTLRQLVEDRLRELPAPTLDALGVVAALPRATLAVVAAVLGRDPAPLLEPAVEANVVETNGEIRLTHPLYGAAVYGLAGLRRGELHARLAAVVTDPEERARHLALATDGTDADVAAVLEEGARVAFARGSPTAAADLAAHALRLTPGADDEKARRRALAEADYRFASGDTARAWELLETLRTDAPAGPARARLLSRQARIHHFARDIGGSVALLRSALEEAGDDAVLRGEIEEGLAWGLLLVREDLEGAADHARSAAEIAAERGDRAALAEGLAAAALAEFVLGRDWEETMERALELEPATHGLRVLRHPSFAHGYCLSCADRIGAARGVFQTLLRRAAEDGDESSVPAILNHLTLIECLAGRWDEATGLADEGYGRAVESGHHPTQTSIVAKRAMVAARRGALDEAHAAAMEALTSGGNRYDPAQPETAMARGGETAIWTLGFVALCRSDPERADRHLRPMTEALLRAGIREPGELRCLPDEIEALVALDRPRDAANLLGVLEDWAARVQRPSVHGAVGRCRALLRAAEGDAEGSAIELEQAVARERETELPLERAKTLLALGAQQRRARQRSRARKTLEGALAIFDELGAAHFAAATRAEVGRIGGRAASPDELTETERRIAELVAAGKKNKEVAAALVVTERTVESALTQIYRKLEVRSRTELARKLGEPA